MASGEGSTKKEAEQRAAQSAMEIAGTKVMRVRTERLRANGGRDCAKGRRAGDPVAGRTEKRAALTRIPTTISEYLESLLVTVLLALFGTSFIVQAFKIPSASMEGTLLIGDHLLVNKFIFGGSGAWYDKLLPYRPVEHGDIIVFKYPYADHQHFVKRVIGLPGDRLKMVDQQMYRQWKAIERAVRRPRPDGPVTILSTIRFRLARDQMISPAGGSGIGLAGHAPQLCARRRTRRTARKNYSPWATTGTAAQTAATGASLIAARSWGGPS